jgi:hypothetical protein
MKHLIYLIFLCAFVGCSQGTVITGTVRFDDGTPVTRGSVVFNSGTKSLRGPISPDGTYTSGGVKEKQGIPDGVYTVWLAGTEESVPSDASGGLSASIMTQVVAPEFRSASKSPLKFEVKKGGDRKFDIVVKRDKTGK